MIPGCCGIATGLKHLGGAARQCRSKLGRGVPSTAMAPTTSSQNGSTPKPGIALQSKSRQQQPLPAKHHEQKQRCPEIHHPHDWRQWGRESADGIGDASDGESKGEPLFGEFENPRNWRPCAGRLFAWSCRRWCHLVLVNVIGNSSYHSPRAKPVGPILP
jgi:hypothetical protein